MSDDISVHLERMRVEDARAPRQVVRYVVFLRFNSMWLGGNNKWLEREDHAEQFETFSQADAASAGYDVIIKTIEVNV